MSISDPFFSRGDFMREMKQMKEDIRALQTAQRGGISGDGVTTYLRDQDFRVIGGTIHVEENGDIVIDGGQIVAGTVTLDASGLKIGGILQPALAVLTASAAGNPTVTTTESTVNEMQFSIPTWANEVTLMTFARLQHSNNSGANQNFINKLVNDVGGLDETTDDEQTAINGTTLSSFVALTTPVSTPGATITCRQRARFTGGASDTVEARIEGFAVIRRTS